MQEGTHETEKKIFVLDTSVIGASGTAVYSFGKNDVVVPLKTIEEYDGLKKGNRDVNFQVRKGIDALEKIISHKKEEWYNIGDDHGKILINIDSTPKGESAKKSLGKDSVDNDVIDTALKMKELYPTREVVLVSRDRALRLKAKSLGVKAEDYLHEKVDDLPSNIDEVTVDGDLIDRLYEKKGLSVEDIPIELKEPNKYYHLRSSIDDKKTAIAVFSATRKRVEIVENHIIYGIRAKNMEQKFALNALLDPDIKLVALQGMAGTGKTLLALAAALEQRRDFKQIYLARPIVPLSNKDIGYLPGDIKSKIDPYMQPLYDNLSYIKSNFEKDAKEVTSIARMLEEEKLLIAPLAYLRGRSLPNIIFIVDEAQNLTPHEIKTIITRAGNNTKIIFTGDINQIDTPYLDEKSNGLSYMIAKLHGQELFSHVELTEGVRSPLANMANNFL